MKRQIISIVLGTLLLASVAEADTSVQSVEPVKQTRSGACFDSGHPNYYKVRNYVATFKTLEDCIKSGGDKSVRVG